MARNRLARRGCFYPEVHYEKDGRSFGRELEPKHTMRAARRVLDDLGVPGSISVWSERQQRRHRGPTRHADGRWTAVDPFTGREVDLAPLPARS